jgi:DNA-binding PadR family transcriptional regulator
VYTTLDRLARDGLVAPDGADPAEPRRRRYRLTDEGRARADRWLVRAARFRVVGAAGQALA